MYWSGCEDQVCEFFKRKELRARKEHECCECDKTIPVGAKYIYSVGKWYDTFQLERTFAGYKMCLSCDRDWKAVISIFKENGKRDACLVFGFLRTAVREAFESGFIGEYNSLIQRWLPEATEPQTEEEVDAHRWKMIEATAVRKGLQSVLPLEIN